MGHSWGGALGTATLLKDQNVFLGWVEIDGMHNPKGMYLEYIENFEAVATQQIEDGNSIDFWPINMRNEIEEVNAKIYSEINNGVYKAGFATTQTAYDNAVNILFDGLDWVENRLQDNRYLLGDTLTEADWRLFTSLVRFDSVYVLHFKCNRKRIVDYHNIWNYVRELYQYNGIKETVDFDHIVRHYHYSHETINPNRIIPTNPIIDWNEAFERNF